MDNSTKSYFHLNSITKSAISFFSGTSISRVSGLLRDISMAFCFGTDPAIAAFLVAFRFAGLLRRIFGEGALLTGFIPYFESCRAESPKKAAEFFRDIFFSLSFVLIFVISLLELLLYGSLNHISSDNQEIVTLTMIMLPGLLFVCLFSLCSGICQCLNRFFLFGAAPVAFNIVWIIAIWSVKDLPLKIAVVALSWAIIFAYIFQWLVTIPLSITFVRSYLSWKELLKGKLFSPDLRKMLASMSLGVIGVAASQINSALDAIFARASSLQGPAFLNYAIHLQQLPLALIGIGFSTALLPSLSRVVKNGEQNQFENMLFTTLSNAIYLLVPITIMILSIGGSTINLIYGHGDFHQESIVNTVYCFWGYGLGLVPMASALILAQAFYAQKDYWNPMLASLFTIIVNIVLNSIFVFWFEWGPASLALSTSIASIFNVIFLFLRLKKYLDVKRLCKELIISWKTLPYSLFSGMITIMLGHKLLNEPTLSLLLGNSSVSFVRNFSEQLFQFIILLSIFALSFVPFVVRNNKKISNLAADERR